GTVDGLVTELLTGNPINGASIMLVSTTGGRTYEFFTGFNGRYTGEVLEDNYDYVVSANGFISEDRSDIDVDFNTTVTEDFQLDEFPFPVNSVVAVATGDDQSVDVYWNSPGVSGGSSVIDENFTGGMPAWFIGDAPEADWHIADDMLTLTTGGAGVWRSGYKDDLYTDLIYQVSQQRNGGSAGGSMGMYVRGNGFADMTPGNGANGNMFCWTTTGSYWYGTLTNGDLPDWSGWTSSGAINQGLGMANIISAEVIGSTATFFINGTEIISAATIEVEGYVGGFAHEGSVASEMAFDYWQIIPGGMGKNATVSNEIGEEGKGSIEECLSANPNSTNVAVKGLSYDTRPVNGDKVLQGYMIYRQDCAGNDPFEFLGMTLDTTFRDNTWGIADWGMYRWAVEAVYDNNNSAAEFSNCLDKDMQTVVGVEVTTNSGDSPLETYVLFTNTSEPELELFYEVELDDTGMHSWDPFRKGVYDIFVHLNGFADITLAGVAIEEAEIFVFLLEELLAPPTDLYVTPTGFATWGGGGEIPFEPFFENFDDQATFDMWEIIVGGSTADTWFWSDGSNNQYGSTVDGTPFAMVDSDDAGPGTTMDELMISPIIDASMVDELIVEFDQYYNNLSSSELADVEVWDGDAWVTVLHQASDAGAWGSPDHQVIDVTEYANDEFRVRFHYLAPGWDWHWAVDNVSVHDNSGKYADNKAFQFFKVWHDGVFSNDTDTTFYQYGTNVDVDILVPGETYLAEVAALYSTGLSAKAEYMWTYLPCDSFPGPLTMDAYNVEGSDDVLVLWGNMIPMELIEINQGYGDPSNGYFQSYDFGYGVNYDFTAYPDALVSAVDFRHSSWGTMGTWDYMIHVVDMDANTIIASVGPFQSTGNDTWEEGIQLGDIATGGATSVAILMEPMSNLPTDAYPCIDSDSEGDPQGSIYGDLGDISALGASTIGNFLMNVWIYTANSGGKSVPVVMNVIEGPAATPRVATDYTFNPISIVTQQEASNKSDKLALALGTNIYRDGEMIAFVAEPDTFYLDMNLEPGYYDFCIATVYSEDDGAHTWTSCVDANCVEDVLVPEDCLAPENLTAEDLTGNGPVVVLNWDAPNGFDPVWLQYDDGVNVDAIGGPTEFSYAVKWDPSQLVDYDGTAVTKVKFFPREAGTS
ncbi:MAG: hypothetical protein GQ527_05345, partial [Bacteroidales bacterium]|nr:hypothetical protein [Bacteroidales bacterium]